MRILTDPLEQPCLPVSPVKFIRFFFDLFCFTILLFVLFHFTLLYFTVLFLSCILLILSALYVVYFDILLPILFHFAFISDNQYYLYLTYIISYLLYSIILIFHTIGVIAVCDVERLTDLEITKKEVLIEKEKMKYGALTGRRKDPGTKKYTPLSRSSLSDRDDQGGLDGRYEENRSSDMKILINENKSAVGESMTNSDHSNEFNGKLDDMNSTKLNSAVVISIPAVAKAVVTVIPAHPHQSTTSASTLSNTQTRTSASSSSSSSSSSSPPLSTVAAVSARESLARSVSSMLYSLSLLGVTFRNLPPEGMESIWRGLRSFSKGTYVLSLISCHSIG